MEVGFGGSGDNICLLVDQFEELFRFARESGRDEAQVLIDVLRAFENPEGAPPGVHAIVTMRSDHLGDCGRYVGFAELVNRTQYLLPRMADAELLRAIREPALLYQGEVTMDLTLRLIQDSTGEADSLPLVQHCLMRLWQQTPIIEPPAHGFRGLAEAPAPFQPTGKSPRRALDLAGLSRLAGEPLGARRRGSRRT